MSEDVRSVVKKTRALQISDRQSCNSNNAPSPIRRKARQPRSYEHRGELPCKKPRKVATANEPDKLTLPLSKTEQACMKPTTTSKLPQYLKTHKHTSIHFVATADVERTREQLDEIAAHLASTLRPKYDNNEIDGFGASVFDSVEEAIDISIFCLTEQDFIKGPLFLLWITAPSDEAHLPGFTKIVVDIESQYGFRCLNI